MLDEATSALDSENESIVQQALDELMMPWLVCLFVILLKLSYLLVSFPVFLPSLFLPSSFLCSFQSFFLLFLFGFIPFREHSSSLYTQTCVRKRNQAPSPILVEATWATQERKDHFHHCPPAFYSRAIKQDPGLGEGQSCRRGHPR